MCALFGIYDYGNKLSSTTKTKLIQSLGKSSEIRGTDASGISYVRNDKLTVYKRPLPAQKMMFYVDSATICVMGHTRMSTQGSEQNNCNNHPFIGKSDVRFSLAHNGIFTNDISLRRKMKLPATQIETDSYIAVQLMEAEKHLNLSTLSNIAEHLEGSFTLTLLDELNRLYFVKGNNPLVVCKIPVLGIYVYASTSDILKTALSKCKLNRYHQEKVNIEQGELMMIEPNSKITRTTFDDSKLSFYKRYSIPATTVPDTDDIRWYAYYSGMSEEEYSSLIECGYTPDDIVEMLYDRELYNDCISDLLI